MIGLCIGLRIVGLLVMTLAIAQCGDGGGGDNDGPDDSPPPGTFIGTLADGGTIRLEVGSIEAIAFTCDDQSIQESFSPPQRVESGGRFAVEFTDAGRKFQIRGEFENDDLVQGTIDDQANECDTTFTARRGDRPPSSPTRTQTPTDGTTPTVTPTTAPTGLTPTATKTPTPVCTTCTPPTTSPTPCPVAVEVVGNAGDNGVLDSGWTGLAHNSKVISDGKLTFRVTCSGTTRPCGVCNVTGPIPNLNADQGDINAQRCSNDTSIKCTDNAPCAAGGGTCAFFFGAPLPLSAGQISTCVVNQVAAAVSGTANVETGAFASTLTLRSSVFTGPLDKPCPRCLGNDTANDGVAGGTCEAGSGSPREGLPCDVNGTSPVTAFGKTSLDCPPKPGAKVAALPIELDGSSGTETVTLTAASPDCEAKPAAKCFCPNAGNNPQQPNACIDDSTTPGVVEKCVPTAAGSNKGECELALATRVCSPTETFRGCGSNAECTAPGDTCVAIRNPCFLDNGAVDGIVEARGHADPPDSNGVSTPVFASLFCIPPTVAVAVNAAGGLPGLGRIELPLISKEIYELP